ncbi:Homeobox domain-containing protein [Mycena chlorophos]|uniref:Homeobox domain-containing protein n=1 Tax=Mycena chlorophos TaxID=658473 RepID=A0A8H6VV76_MYCCL|nr:Homeobox domain-containing protein [Mycena chlorophos]
MMSASPAPRKYTKRTPQQLAALEAAFVQCEGGLLESGHREQLISQLGLTKQYIRVWWTRRRAKDRAQAQERASSTQPDASSPCEPSSDPPSDPVSSVDSLSPQTEHSSRQSMLSEPIPNADIAHILTHAALPARPEATQPDIGMSRSCEPSSDPPSGPVFSVDSLPPQTGHSIRPSEAIPNAYIPHISTNVATPASFRIPVPSAFSMPVEPALPDSIRHFPFVFPSGMFPASDPSSFSNRFRRAVPVTTMPAPSSNAPIWTYIPEITTMAVREKFSSPQEYDKFCRELHRDVSFESYLTERIRNKVEGEPLRRIWDEMEVENPMEKQEGSWDLFFT